MSLHDDQPLDGYERGALARSLATPEAEDWWAGLPPNTRRAIMNKLIAALAKAESPRDIGTLSRSLMKADELDLKRRQGAPASSAPGSNAPTEMFREILVEVRNASAHQHPAEADSEPAGDD